MNAVILDIQRMSTEDGPGLRTTVFFKGCNLACPWCHNPESISRKPDLNWFDRKCMGCDTCKTLCPQGAILKDQGGLRFDRSRCAADFRKNGDGPGLSCQRCAEGCPNGAIEIKGRSMEVEELCRELLKDRAYFGAEGGITLSGGEALMQGEAAAALAKSLKAAGISVAVDTAGCYDYRVMEAMLPHIDLVLYDIKIFDAALHKRLVGTDNLIILENYRKLAEGGVRVWVRTPIIEGATDGEENIKAIGDFIRRTGLPEKWELCAFNNLCRDKYDRLDRDWDYKNTGLTLKAHIEGLTEIARERVPRAVYSGATREGA
ncbi:MAG: glycyl-radical enzyme activating protein [Spirochaetaceae bacterium]|jgi:pyruvate formate lyase activating enzyme|nr:glycyl-radical enzyme activating protein [Spirochaetaceae bacterium]